MQIQRFSIGGAADTFYIIFGRVVLLFLRIRKPGDSRDVSCCPLVCFPPLRIELAKVWAPLGEMVQAMVSQSGGCMDHAGCEKSWRR